MNSFVTPFYFEAQIIRVVTDDGGEPWFVAKEVCEILGYGNPRQAIESHVDIEDVQKLDTLTLGGMQPVNHINESGLYSLVFGSTKDSAKRFKRWVTHEVLPSIRKTGRYAVEAAPAFNVPTTLSAALRLAADQAETIESQKQQIEAAKPAVSFVEKYVDATGNKGFRQVCKLLGANEARFREFLKDAGIMYVLGGEWVPHAQHINAGRFVVKAGISKDTEHAFNSARFTPKGIAWVAGEWAKRNIAPQLNLAA